MPYCECPEHAAQENAACQSCLANYWKAQYYKTQAELSALRDDAERYHWIKQCALFGITKRQDIVLTLPIYDANHMGELDAAIDKARKGEGE